VDPGHERVMQPNDYRENAAECLRLAHEAQDARTKFVMLEMAQAWMRLAEHSEKLRDWIGLHNDPVRPDQPSPLR
jgi:hypothetical protein